MKDDAAAQMSAAIAVENIEGPVLMIGGRADGVRSSAEMVEAITARLHRAHFPYPVVALLYDHAGHRAEMPEIIPVWHKGVMHPVSGTAVDFGGSTEGNAASTIDAIPTVLDFLRTSLKQNAEPGASEISTGAKAVDSLRPW